MNDQQAYLLKLLCEIDEICARHGIDYALSDGSLIGAVRHGGFLPWDDDADIKMTRPNWLRFQEACKTELPANRRLDVPTDPGYSNTLPRYTSLDTTAIHAHQCLDDSFEGVPIDIFILEPIRSEGDAISAYTHDLMLYSDVVNCSGVFGRRFGVSAEEYEECLRLVEEKGEAWVRERFEERLVSHLDEDGDVYVMRWGGNPIVYERAWFDSTTRVDFEGHSFQAPAGIDEYLSYHYGDEWYQVPRIAEQPEHDMADSLLVPAREAEGICLEEDRHELKRRMYARKTSMLANAPRGYELGVELLRCEGGLLAADTLSRWDEHAEELSAGFRPEDSGLFEEVFGHHIAWQFSARVAGRDDWNGVQRLNNPVVAELPDEPRHALLSYLYNCEQLGRAARLLQMLEQTGHRLDAFERGLRGDIERLRAARAKLQYGRAAESCALCAGLRGDAPCNKTALKTELSALLSLAEQGASGAGGRGAAHEAAELLDEACAWYPEDGDFAFYRERFARLAAGGTPGADSQELLRRAVLHTRNGMVLHEVARDEACDGDVRATARRALSGEDVAGKGSPSAFDAELAARYRGLQAEVLRLCGKLGLRAILNPLQARALAAGEGEGAGFAPADPSAWSLALEPEDLQRLVEHLRKHPRCLPDWVGFECMATNPTFPDFGLRFCDLRTTDLSSRTTANYEHAGMHLSVQALKPKRLPEGLAAAGEEWRRGCFSWRGENELARPTRARRREGRRLFEEAMEAFAEPSKKRRLLLGGHALDYPSKLFTQLERVELEGGQAWRPADLERYLAPVEALEARGGSFGGARSFISPRIAIDEEDRAAYERVRSEQSDRARGRPEDVRTREDFKGVLARQKEALAAEDARRREAAADGGRAQTGADTEKEFSA